MNATNQTSSATSMLEDGLAACISFLCSFFGLLVNGGVAAHLRRLPKLKGQSFAHLCVSMAAADCAILGIFAFWSSPLTLV